MHAGLGPEPRQLSILSMSSSSRFNESDATDLTRPASSALQICSHCGALIDVGDREPLETSTCPGCGTTLVVKGELGGLQLIEVAGRGGMGVVYKAYDPSLDRYIAVKLLPKRNSADSILIDELETEAAITASVIDPHVVRVYGTGIDRGRFYIAMELVSGGSLDDLIREQFRVGEVQVLQIGIQIAQGLRAAHQAGLIHRDVKPGNILFDENHHAKIVDFGLALFMSQVDEAESMIWGTPYYIAPEKLEGGAEDFRSDIYSLGGTLFHALTGRPPFEGASPTLVAIKHLKSRPVSLQAFAPWVSNSTAHIINKALEKNPADRYASYDDFIHALQYGLERLQSGEAGSPSRSRVVMETDDYRKIWTWVILGMAAIIVLLMVIFVTMRPKPGMTVSMPSAVAGTAKGPAFARELKALSSQDEKAAEMFKALAANEGTSATDRTWAYLFEGVAHLLSGRGLEAKNAFERVPSSASRMKDQEVAAFLTEVSQKLAARQPMPIADVKKLSLHSYQTVGYFLHGLNSWFNGRREDGAAILNEFRSTTPTGSAAWIQELKALTSLLMEESMIFQLEVEKFQQAKSTGDRLAAATVLRKLSPAYATQVEAIISPYTTELARYQEVLAMLPEPGVYRIINKLSDKCMDVIAHGRAPRTTIVQWENYGGTNQMWEIVPRSTGAVTFRSIHSGLVMDLPNSSMQPDTAVQIWEDNGLPAVIWRLEPKEAPWFQIRSTASNQLLGVRNNRHSGTQIAQTDRTEDQDTLWRFERAGVRIDEWVTSDVGIVTGPGEALIKGGTFTLTAESGDIWANQDSFRFIFQEVPGDFDFSARVVEIRGTDPYTKAGIIIRSGAVPNDANVFAYSTAEKGVAAQVRPKPDALTELTGKSKENAPCWLKLSRREKVVSTFFSTDGKNWQQLGTDTSPVIIKAPTVGLALCSHNREPVAAKFDNVRLTKP